MQPGLRFTRLETQKPCFSQHSSYQIKYIYSFVGNTSQDSGGSGSHKSMLELLSITDAAVKALNKSTRSHGSTASHASGRSLDSDRSVKSTHR